MNSNRLLIAILAFAIEILLACALLPGQPFAANGQGGMVGCQVLWGGD